ncbi:MAG: hypothetical protein CBC31_010305 [Verrucomicrobia bacterium TMED71]|nr:MAG: hypothetical protein CBC31_010305 [Verrucomicrobia bacterium TMED71]
MVWHPLPSCAGAEGTRGETGSLREDSGTHRTGGAGYDCAGTLHTNIPAWLCKKYRHKVINIHHSFLPSFIGAKPYHQADEREVDRRNLPLRLTENLDAGPIIE